MVANPGLFKPGSVSPNKGRTLESWVGEERARDIKARMSQNSLKKAAFLRKLNESPGIAKKRAASRKFHDDVVQWIADNLRREGNRVFTLSEYIKEKRIPDAIIYDGATMVALEVETDKKCKPSRPATTDRLSRLNALSGFFDRTVVVFPRVGDNLSDIGPGLLAAIKTKEALNPDAQREG